MNKQEFSEDKWFFQDYRINKWWGTKSEPQSAQLQTLTPFFNSPWGEVDGVCISIAPRAHRNVQPPVQGTCYYSSSHPNSKGHSQGQSAAWEHQNPRSGSLWCEHTAQSLSIPWRSLEGPRLLKIPPLKLAHLSTQLLFFNWKTFYLLKY